MPSISLTCNIYSLISSNMWQLLQTHVVIFDENASLRDLYREIIKKFQEEQLKKFDFSQFLPTTLTLNSRKTPFTKEELNDSLKTLGISADTTLILYYSPDTHSCYDLLSDEAFPEPLPVSFPQTSSPITPSLFPALPLASTPTNPLSPLISLQPCVDITTPSLSQDAPTEPMALPRDIITYSSMEALFIKPEKEIILFLNEVHKANNAEMIFAHFLKYAAHRSSQYKLSILLKDYGANPNYLIEGKSILEIIFSYSTLRTNLCQELIPYCSLDTAKKGRAILQQKQKQKKVYDNLRDILNSHITKLEKETSCSPLTPSSSLQPHSPSKTLSTLRKVSKASKVPDARGTTQATASCYTQRRMRDLFCSKTKSELEHILKKHCCGPQAREVADHFLKYAVLESSLDLVQLLLNNFKADANYIYQKKTLLEIIVLSKKKRNEKKATEIINRSSLDSAERARDILTTQGGPNFHLLQKIKARIKKLKPESPTTLPLPVKTASSKQLKRKQPDLLNESFTYSQCLPSLTLFNQSQQQQKKPREKKSGLHF